MTWKRTTVTALIGTLAIMSVTYAFAWTGPTASPPGNNVAAPINVGTVDQVKNGGLGVNALTVFGNSLLGGSTGSNAYLNFGPTSGTNGYGIRDNAGLLEFKNSGGSWQSLQSIIFTLGGAWTTSGNNIYNNNTGNVGIGTASPAAKLDVVGDIFSNGSNAWLFHTPDDGRTGLYFGRGSNGSVAEWSIEFKAGGGAYFAGNVGIGTAIPGKKLDVQGDINVSGNQYVNGVKAYFFGGLYVTASTLCPAINNPLTGAQSCPAGFTAFLVFGALCNASDASVRSIYMCVK